MMRYSHWPSSRENYLERIRHDTHVDAHWHCERCGWVLEQVSYCLAHYAYGLACPTCATNYTFEKQELRFHIGVHVCEYTQTLPELR